MLALSSKDFRDHKDYGRTDQAAAEKHINKRIADCGEGREKENNLIHI